MQRCFWQSLAAATMIFFATAADAAFHLFKIDQIYSNADGTVQFVVLTCGAGCVNGENFWMNQSLTATGGKSFTFPSNLPSSSTSGKKVLVGTQGFAALGVVAPDYTIPNGFIPLSGTVNYAGVDQVSYGSLPTDGTNAIYRDGTVRQNVATNFAGASGSVTASAPPGAANYQGLWWAGGNESGWGINFAHSGNQLFGTWYTYDTTGKAWWLSTLATQTAPGSNAYQGPVYVDTGPPFNNFAGVGVPTQIGTATLTFSDANNGTFAYNLNAGSGGSMVPVSQAKAIVRYDLGTGPQPTCAFDPGANLALATNYQDLWWAASGTESGWGVNFQHQGDTIYATWYTYDVDGTPLWLSSLAPRVGATNVYTGPIYRTAGPRFDAFVGPPASTLTVGTATLTFASGNSATFRYATNGTGALPVVDQTKSIVRFPFTASGGTVCR